MFALRQLTDFFNYYNEPEVEQQTTSEGWELILEYNDPTDKSLTEGVSNAVINTAGYIGESISNTAGYIGESVLGTRATRTYKQEVRHPNTGKMVEVTLYLEGEISDMDVLHALAGFQEYPEGYDYDEVSK